MADKLMKKMLTCLLVVRKTSKSSHVIAVMVIRAVSPMVSEEVKALGLAHGAGGNVRCDRRLESSSTPGNLPLREKGLNKEGLWIENEVDMSIHSCLSSFK